MSSYALHPEAFADLGEIWEYIAEDNIDAADRVLADVLLHAQHACSITTHRAPTAGPDHAAAAISSGARRLPHCLRT